jgi:hypothetical protein
MCLYLCCPATLLTVEDVETHLTVLAYRSPFVHCVFVKWCCTNDIQFLKHLTPVTVV